MDVTKLLLIWPYTPRAQLTTKEPALQHSIHDLSDRQITHVQTSIESCGLANYAENTHCSKNHVLLIHGENK